MFLPQIVTDRSQCQAEIFFLPLFVKKIVFDHKKISISEKKCGQNFKNRAKIAVKNCDRRQFGHNFRPKYLFYFVACIREHFCCITVAS